MSNDNSLFIRLYIDEDVHGNLSIVLRQEDYDVLTVNEAKRNGLSDAEQLAYATEQKRAIFTFNAADFIVLHLDYLQAERSHAGIIVSKQISLEETIHRLLFLLNQITADEIYNQLRWLPPLV
jgi:hypothetical protein